MVPPVDLTFQSLHHLESQIIEISQQDPALRMHDPEDLVDRCARIVQFVQCVNACETTNGSISKRQSRHFEGDEVDDGSVSRSQPFEDPLMLILGAISGDDVESRVGEHGRHSSAAGGEFDDWMVNDESCA